MSRPAVHDSRAIGIFDSGVGGLTVLDALRSTLPRENLIYLGDTARVPYGTKSPESVIRYALQATATLAARDIKLLVVACNTASAFALPALRTAFAPLPVIGVIEPGARAACAATRTGRLAILATEATVSAGAYQRAIAEIAPHLEAHAIPCSVLVAVAEEGWREGPLTEAIVAHYLAPLHEDRSIDTLVLGCTHFPVLKRAIAAAAGPGRALIDSASTTATEVAAILSERGLNRPHGERGRLHFLVTDGPERFIRVAHTFFGGDIPLEEIELVDITHPVDRA